MAQTVRLHNNPEETIYKIVVGQGNPNNVLNFEIRGGQTILYSAGGELLPRFPLPVIKSDLLTLEVNNVHTAKLPILGGIEIKSACFLDKYFPLHFHQSWSLTYIESGTENISFNDIDFLLNKSALILIPPYSLHKNWGNKNNAWTYKALYLHKDIIENIAEKLKIGLSPLEYQTVLRIEKSKQLFFEKISLSHIALESGFYDQSHFSHCFKKYVGVIPGKYKTNCNILQDNK